MDYGKLLTRTWQILRDHPFLILLGVVVALSGGEGLSAVRGFDMGSGATGRRFFDAPPGRMPVLDVAEILIILLLIGLALALAMAFWAAATIARGGLIAGVNSVESGEATRFSTAWRAGWEKGWRLLGIGIIPAIPGLLLVILGVAVLFVVGGLAQIAGGRSNVPAVGGFVALALGTLCLAIPITVVLGVLRDLANRACMLEDLGVIDAYRRAWKIAGDNLGEVIILFLIQVAIGVVVGILLIFPGFILCLCCFLWPLFLVIRGAVAAYVSGLWTLAWREWTGLAAAAEPMAEAPPVA